MAVRDRGGLSFRVDDSDLARQIAALRRTDPEIVKALRRGMRAAGNVARDEVRAAAAVTHSRRIPRSVKVATRINAKSVRVTLRADAKVAPHSKVMEGRRGGKPLRHPVFADAKNKTRTQWTWVPQKPRPYFYNTVRGRAESVQRAVFDLVSEAVRQSVRGRR